MTDRWLDVLATLRARFAPDADVRDLERFLAEEGLDRREIGEVLSLYFADPADDLDASGPVADAAPRRMLPARPRSGWSRPGRPLPGHPDAPALRVQGPHERGRFSAEAWGYLVTLSQSRVVSAFDFERLVERALIHLDGRIGLAELQALADDVGVDAASLAADRTLLH